MVNKPQVTRVLIVDDHVLLLELLGHLISQEPDLELAGSCKSGLEALKLIGVTQCDVVILDLVMPGIDGLLCARELRRAHPELKVLVVSGNTNPLSVGRAMLIGVRGYVEKSAATKEILDAVREVAAGRTYFGRSLQPTVKRIQSSPFPLDAAEYLSPRERSVLAGIAEGRTSKSIADLLGLSEFTIKNHRRRIKSKTGLQTNAELILHAAKLGLHKTDGL